MKQGFAEGKCMVQEWKDNKHKLNSVFLSTVFVAQSFVSLVKWLLPFQQWGLQKVAHDFRLRRIMTVSPLGEVVCAHLSCGDPERVLCTRSAEHTHPKGEQLWYPSCLQVQALCQKKAGYREKCQVFLLKCI